ncbi:MAG TPA: hypothetical protein DIU30_07425 [Clostridiales bacterium]|jgi:hypothetical protein|nr:hypothetical protein [Clostridium sp.]MEE1379514.1 hypothetical protein [Clostridia bacterium]HCQ56150.1 hypothetical protein [Clostridiales bacterium]
MNNEKTKSVLAYIFGLIGGLIVLMMKGSEKRTKICAAQSITIALIYYIVRVAYGFIPFNIPFFDYIVSGLYLVASIIGIVKACNDNEEPEISGIGEIAKSLFKKQIEQ